MALAKSVADQRWIRADGRCEVCKRVLEMSHRGDDTEYGWDVYPVNPGEPNTVENCRIVCIDCRVARSD